MNAINTESNLTVVNIFILRLIYIQKSMVL